MNRRFSAPTVCVALSTLALCYGAHAADDSTWFRWKPGGGVVQHVLSNDSDAPRKLMIGSRFHGDCKSNDLPTFSNDPRFSFVIAAIELKPHTWVALYSLIAEGEVGCSIDLMLAKPGGEAERLSSVKLAPGADRIDFFPFHSGEVTVDASVVRDDLLHAFEPAGTNIQVQVRARNLSAEPRMVAITGRRLDCGKSATYDWVVGPGEAPSNISAGPAVVRSRGTVVFSQRLRGSGDYKGCKVSFTLSDARRPTESKMQLDEPSMWVAIKELSVALDSAQVISYR